MCNSQIKSFDIIINLDPVNDGPVIIPKRIKVQSKHALVIGTDGQIRIVDEDETDAIAEQLQENGKSLFIGNTNYLMIYNGKKVVETDNGPFFVGSCLIVKGTSKGVEYMTDDEIMEAKREFTSRLVNLVGGGIEFTAFEI